MKSKSSTQELAHNLRDMADLLTRWPIFAEVGPFAIEASGGLVVADSRTTHLHTLHLQIGPDGAQWALLANDHHAKPNLMRFDNYTEQPDMLAAIEAAMKTQPSQYPNL